MPNNVSCGDDPSLTKINPVPAERVHVRRDIDDANGIDLQIRIDTLRARRRQDEKRRCENEECG